MVWSRRRATVPMASARPARSTSRARSQSTSPRTSSSATPWRRERSSPASPAPTATRRGSNTRAGARPGRVSANRRMSLPRPSSWRATWRPTSRARTSWSTADGWQADMVTAVVTGGGGFVMTNFLRHWLESSPNHEAVALDASPLDAAAQRYFAPVADRVRFVQGDVASPDMWAKLPANAAYVVHGAAVTPHAYTDAGGRHRDPESEDPLRILNANIMGTAHALD